MWKNESKSKVIHHKWKPFSILWAPSQTLVLPVQTCQNLKHFIRVYKILTVRMAHLTTSLLHFFSSMWQTLVTISQCADRKEGRGGGKVWEWGFSGQAFCIWAKSGQRLANGSRFEETADNPTGNTEHWFLEQLWSEVQWIVYLVKLTEPCEDVVDEA